MVKNHNFNILQSTGYVCSVNLVVFVFAKVAMNRKKQELKINRDLML